MQINSINTNLAAYSAQSNIKIASSNASKSVARLSSGQRITQAADDVAGLAIGTSLATNVRTLRTALTNASQAGSLLQVADAALNQITEILQRQKAIAVQAGSGTLGATERSFLNAEFTALTSEIDRIAANTNFNGVKLINGGLNSAASVTTTTTHASTASNAITFTDNIAVGESVVIGGVTLIAGTTDSGTTFQVGGTLAQSVSNLAARLTALTTNPSYNNTLGQATYGAVGNTLNITARAGGSLSNSFAVKTALQAATTATGQIATGASGANTNLTFTLGTNHGFVVGQQIRVAGQTASIDGVTAAQINSTFTIASVTATTITVASTGTATAGSTSTGSVSGVKVTADLANTQNVEANTSGSYGGSSFNVFATGFSSATAAISNNTAASGTPFQNGDSITVNVNGGTSKTLATLTAAAGTANSSGDYSLTDIVNGINANTGTTGYKAELTYNGSTYNIRLGYDTLQSNVILNLGTNYNSTTNGLNGATIDAANIIDGAGAAARNRAIFNTGYVDLLASSIGAVAVGATVIGTTATAPFVAGDSILAKVNGTTHLLHTFVAADGFDDIIASINAKSAVTGIYAAVVGTSADVDNIRLFLTQPGTSGDQISLTYSGAVGHSAGDFSTATIPVTTSGTVSQNAIFGLAGGTDNGLGQGSVSVTGDTSGDTILTDLSQTKANVSVIMTQNAVAADTLTVGGQIFYYVSAAPTAANQIQIGSTLQDTLDNTVKTLNNYQSNGHAIGDTAYQLNQINVSRAGNSLVFEGKGLSNVTKLNGTGASVAQSITGASLTNSGNLNNAASTFGVDTTGVTNAAFNDKISGFKAVYNNTADTADLSIKVGDFTYTASSVDLTNSTDTRVRFYSDTVGGKSGGFFDVQLSRGQVSTFASQSAANTVASRLDAAFSNLTFIQKHDISSYTGTSSIVAGSTVVGSLVGTKVSAQLSSFDSVKLTDVTVTPPVGSSSDAKVSLTINGATFSTGNSIGSTLAANQTYRLTSAADANEFVEFTTGNSAIDLSSSANAAAFQAALKTAFGATDGSASLVFQVGTSTSDSLNVSISDAQSTALFAGATLDVLTQESAAIAVAALDTAISNVTSVRATVGALQSRFNFAAANIESSIQNQDAARGTLLDTDIAEESTSYAIAQVKMQAGISVLAQANQQLQSLLKLIG